MKNIRLASILFSLLCLLGQPLRSAAQSTAFTYQGRLQDGTNAVTGLYDFEFRLFNAALGGAQQGPTVTLNDLGVTNGLFLAALDFGANFPGADRFLQLSVRPGASGGAYTALNPRQPITATPYSIRSLEAAGLPAGAVSGAMLADGAVTAAKIAPGAVSQLGSPDGSPVNAVQVNTNGLVGLGTNAPQAGLHIASGRPFINLELIQSLADEQWGITNLSGASAVAVDGNLMAVCSIYDSGVVLFDVANPSLPAFTAQFRSGDDGFAGLGQVHRVALRSNLLVVASYDGVVSLINVSNRSAPVLTAQIRDGFGGWNEIYGVNHLAFSGNLLAIAARGDSAVTLLDASNPANPIKRAEIKDGFFGFTNLWGASAVAFKGNFLFIGADQDRAVTVVDVTTPFNPIKVTELRQGFGGFSSFGFVMSMAVAGNTLAVGNDIQLILVDVSNPAAPLPGAILTANTQPAIGYGVNGLAAAGNLLAVAPQFLSRAVVLDVSQPSSPQIYAETDKLAWPLTTQNTYATVAFIQSNLVFSIRDASVVSFLKPVSRTLGLVSAGWVGIGVSDPAASLHVAGDLLVEGAARVDLMTSVLRASAGSVMLGAGAMVDSESGGMAVGEGSLVKGREGVAIGYGSRAIGDHSLATGYGSEAVGIHSTAIGTAARAPGNYSVSLGNNTVAGGRSATALGEVTYALGDRTLAAGYRSAATHGGSFVWADSQDMQFVSTATNQFSVRASGGVRLETAGAGLTVDGLKVLTTPGDSQGFLLAINGQPALRLEPTAGTPNYIGGFSGNIVSNGVVGAVIGGGGGEFLGQVYPHRIGGNYASVLGGIGNIAAGAVSTAFGNQTKALAANATAFGSGTVASGQYSVAMGGGASATGRSSTAMGEGTVASGAFATAMGLNSTASGENALAAGLSVIASGTNSMALGRRARAQHNGSLVWADQQDFDFASTANNQFSIRASGGVRLHDDTSIGFGSWARQMINLWSVDYGIGVQDSAAYFRSGGDFFWYRGGIHSDTNGSAGGGTPLMTLSRNGRIGLGNTTPSYPLDAQSGQAVARFTTTNSINGAVLVLQNTTASPSYLGAINFDTAGSTVGQIGYLGGDDMAFRVGGIERMRLNIGGLTVNGTFVSASDRNVKEGFAAVDAQAVLEKVASLPLQSWSYTNRPGVKHVGPMAQDFRAAFGLGEDDKHIATVDADGVALAAIQGLNQKLEVRSQESGNRMQKLEAENAELRKAVADLKELVERLASLRKEP